MVDRRWFVIWWTTAPVFSSRERECSVRVRSPLGMISLWKNGGSVSEAADAHREFAGLKPGPT